jgi:hypothetical protein
MIPFADAPHPYLEIILSDLELRGWFNPKDIEFISTTSVRSGRVQGRQRSELDISTTTNSKLRVFVRSIYMPSVVGATLDILLQVSDQSRTLNRNILQDPTNHGLSIGISRRIRPFTASQWEHTA